jgi:UDP-glucose 4-epimerase
MQYMKKILVTGGAGFIGSHTVIELIKAGYEPIIVDNFSNSEKRVLQQLNEITGKTIAFYELDCTDYEAFKTVFQKEQLSGVIHFAAYKAVGESVKLPLKYYHNNIGSMTVLMRLMKEFTVQELIFSSSCTVYGEPDQLPVTEETPTKPATSPYGFTKQVCEQFINDVVNSGANLRACTLRYFNPIGAHPSSLIGELPLGTPENLIPYVTQTAIGIRDQLTVFGDTYNTVDGSCVRDYIHVVDLANAHVKSLQWLGKQEKESLNEVFNVGTGKGDSVLEVISSFTAVNEVKLNYKIGPKRAGDIEQIYASVNKAKDVIGWTAQYSLEDALRDAWNWQKALATSSSN